MFYFLKLAAGNIVKNRRNTFTIALVVAVCVFFMEFMAGYMDGFKDKIANDTLERSGHITVYNREYYNSLDFMPLDYNIEITEELINGLKGHSNVTGVREEINFGGVLNSEYDNIDVMVKAINIQNENPLYESRKRAVTEGRFIENPGEFVIGFKAARLLGVERGDSVILLTMDQYGGMNAIEGVITGFFVSNMPSEDEGLLICALSDAQDLLGLEGRVTEIFLNIRDYEVLNSAHSEKRRKLIEKSTTAETPEEREKFAAEADKKYPLKGAEKTAKELEDVIPGYAAAVPWQEEQPAIRYALEMLEPMTFAVSAILVFVAAMGITNSFLMNIMGRMPEFGVMRAMGLSTKQMFGMIVSESFLLGVIGTAAGMIPGVGLVYYFQKNPINYG
ncbi:MAG TPA: ABC transporter permease, partial [Firmicutes bacterium]|nr:ABC transporter permease [Bacillota bacterium]